jgi:hypothetical protein
VFKVAGLLFTAGILSACSLEPSFGRGARERSYYCYTENPASHLLVTFADKDASVIVDGRSINLTFVASVWPSLEDKYEGQGYTLTLDPEALLSTPDGRRIGPCQG